MKLTSKTREIVDIGTMLKDGNGTMIVTNKYPCGTGFCITIVWIDAKNKWLLNRTIYGQKLSGFYGCEIVEP